MEKPHIGLIGLGVMGGNLIRNIESRGFPCAVFNRTYDVTDKFLKEHSGKNFVGAKTLQEFVATLKAPRQILIMVKAGSATGDVVNSLLPFVERGDVIVDLGNSYFTDTVQREELCKKQGVHFLGVGVSGGEEGALKGPSIMPGGEKEAWKLLAPAFDAISARAPEPCHAYIGPGGSGHFVKMVHNGIEYGDMQLIAEAYHLLKSLCGCEPTELAEIFGKWNGGVLSSFLIEITSKIFKQQDDDGQGFLVDKILDSAGQKGTGKWTAQVALDLGIAIPTLALAVDARFLSALKTERVHAATVFQKPASAKINLDRTKLIAAIHDALYCSKIVSYAQGMALLQAASNEWKWNLRLDEIARIWRGGCIIRAAFLNEITNSYRANPELKNLLLSEKMRTEISSRMANWRQVVSIAAEQGVPVMAFSSALSYFDSYRSADLPQNLTQAQRDFFGSHTYERVDKKGVFHTEWEK